MTYIADSFLNFQIGPGKNNDKTFGTECLATLRPGDLCIRDLGYFFIRGFRSNGSTWHLLYFSIEIKHECICEKIQTQNTLKMAQLRNNRNTYKLM